MQRIRVRNTQRVGLGLDNPITRGAIMGSVACAILVALLWAGLAIHERFGIPFQYQQGIWLQAGDQWVAKNKTATLKVSPDPDSESARTTVRVNDFQKYWFEVQLPNGSFKPIKERNQATISVAADSDRIIRIYDRKTGKLVSSNRIWFEINP